MNNNISARNAEAIAQTLVHHGKGMQELQDQINSLNQQLIAIRNEMAQQKQLIIKSLTQKYGHGSTVE